MDNRRLLADLMGDYHHSESGFYFNLKKKLEEGITISYEAWEFSNKKPPAYFYLDHLLNHSHDVFFVSTDESFFENTYRVIIGENDNFEIGVQVDGEWILPKKKISLTGFNSYSITKDPLEQSSNSKKKVFNVFLRLSKSGSFRADAERKTFQELTPLANSFKTQIKQSVEDMKDRIKSPIGTFTPELVTKTLVDRLSLWGFDDVSAVDSLFLSDFGIKDVIHLFLVAETINVVNYDNKRLLQKINGDLDKRRKAMEKIKSYYEKV